MNKAQRKELERAIGNLDGARNELENLDRDSMLIEHVREKTVWYTTRKDPIGGIASDVENMASEERDKFDNMSEGLQNSENGEKLSEIADILDEAHSTLEDLEGHDLWTAPIADITIGDHLSNVDEVIDSLQKASDKTQEVINR